VDEPSIEDTIRMLRGLKDRYEAHHKISFRDDALVAAARLSARYVTDRRLPDKAIDLMDEAAAKLRVALYSLPPELKEMKTELERLQAEEEQAGLERDYERAARKKAERLRTETDFNAARQEWEDKYKLDETVDVNDIADVVAQWTGIPVAQMMETEQVKLLKMEDRLSERIRGQEEAIHAVSDAIRRARSGLKDPRHPIGSFIFIGPSGVGKTELAKALASFMFGDEEALVRLDMSEYREQHTASRLFGAPPGYVGYEEGGQLTEAVRRRPYRVILFDEIEKAHPEVWNALLQILDDGRLTDGQGRIVDFRNTVLIMTSNLGTEFVKRGGSLGFLPQGVDNVSEERAAQDKIQKALKSTFRPEFLNRIDEIILFSPLGMDQMRDIVALQMKEVATRLEEHGLTVELSPATLEWLAQTGYDPAFGARPLRRALQKFVESPLSVSLLSGEFQQGDHVLVDLDENQKLVFKKAEPVTSSVDEYQARVVELLERVYPFRMLEETDLFWIAEAGEVLRFDPGQDFYEQGQPAEYFHLILEGNVNLSYNTGKMDVSMGLVEDDDQFGVEVIDPQAIYLTSAVAVTEGLLFRLHRDAMLEMLQHLPELNLPLHMLVHSLRLSLTVNLDWRAPDEAIFYFDRRHPFFMLRRLIFPVFLFLSGLVVLTYFALTNTPGNLLPGFAAGVVTFVAGLWGI
jgi:hypothetical protein